QGRRFRAFRLVTTRSTGGRNPAWRADFREEKGPGDCPSPCVWGWNAEPDPRPLPKPDSNAWALRAWIRRFGRLVTQRGGSVRAISLQPWSNVNVRAWPTGF